MRILQDLGEERVIEGLAYHAVEVRGPKGPPLKGEEKMAGLKPGTYRDNAESQKPHT